MGTPKKWLCEVDPTVVKTARQHRNAGLPRRTSSGIEEDNGDALNRDSVHSAQSKHTMATAGETSTAASNTSSSCRPDTTAWSMHSLVPTDDNDRPHERFFDSFVVCNEDGGANPWWEDLESPCKASREKPSQPHPTVKPPSSEKTKSPSKTPSKSSRSSSSKPSPSSSKQRDETPRSPTRKSSGRSSDHKNRALTSPRRDERESRSQRRTSSKSPAKTRKDRPEYRKCLSQSSIQDIPAIDLAGPQASILSLGPREAPAPRTKSPRKKTTRSSVSPSRRVTKNTDETEPVSSAAKSAMTKRRDHPSSRPAVANAERKDPRRTLRTESSDRQSRHLNSNRTGQVKSPTPAQVRVESPVRTRSGAVDESMFAETGRNSPKKSKSAPVKTGGRHSKVSSRRQRSATTPASASADHQVTKDDVFDFIAAQIRHLEQATDLAIEFTVRRPEDHRRASMDNAAIATTSNNSSNTSSSNNNNSSSNTNTNTSSNNNNNNKHTNTSDGRTHGSPGQLKTDRRRSSLCHP